MQLTLAEISSMVTRLNQGRNDYSTSELSLYANMALYELCEQHRMKGRERLTSCPVASLGFDRSTGYEKLVTPNSNGAYPSVIISILNPSEPPGSPGRSLKPASIDWVTSRSTASGVPTHYAWFQEEVNLWPSCNSSTMLFEVRYIAKPETMVASTSTPCVDPKWHPAIAYRAAAIAAATRNDLEQEAINQARYISFVNSMPPDEEIRQRHQGGFGVSLPPRA